MKHGGTALHIRITFGFKIYIEQARWLSRLNRIIHTTPPKKTTSQPKTQTIKAPRLFSRILRLAEIPRHIAVLDHTLYLPPHGQEHQDQPVHHQHRPEDRQVENLAPTAREREGDRACRGVPEFELRQASHEGLEFLVGFCGQRGGLACGHAVFHVRVAFERGVEFGRDEGEEEVEEVDA